jgi:hypothetical protein
LLLRLWALRERERVLRDLERVAAVPVPVLVPDVICPPAAVRERDREERERDADRLRVCCDCTP